MRILILHGPNLNLLGRREPALYGAESFETTFAQLQAAFPGHELELYQSNHEGALIDRIHLALDEDWQGFIVNAGALSHSSYALYDALCLLTAPVIEVHISHIFSREDFRRQSVLAPACRGMISGLGRQGYALAVQALLNLP